MLDLGAHVGKNGLNPDCGPSFLKKMCYHLLFLPKKKKVGEKPNVFHILLLKYLILF